MRSEVERIAADMDRQLNQALNRIILVGTIGFVLTVLALVAAL